MQSNIKIEPLSLLDNRLDSQSQDRRWVRASDLPQLFASWDLAYRCRRAGWLKPFLKGPRRTLFRMRDVIACQQRIESGELPAQRIRRSLPD